jgi:hypothetical protein
MRTLWLLLVFAASACHAAAPVSTPDKAVRVKAPCKCEVATVLDQFHAAAARADEDGYFAAFAPEGVFLGTDESERWDVPAFRAYVHPHFSQGKGWAYHPRDRHVSFSREAQTAWFDELLDHDRYGVLRGSGVLVKRDGAWKIAQYNLTFMVPNDKAKAVVALIGEP